MSRVKRADGQAQQEHDEARDVFNLLNDQLVTELPQFVDLRIRKPSQILSFYGANGQPTWTHHSKQWSVVSSTLPKRGMRN